MRKRFLTGIAALSIGSSPLLAQQTDLDPVTISASMNPMQVSRTGRNIIVIKGDKFLSLPVHSLDELLRYVPGLEVQARGPMGAQSDIVLRGGTFQQVLVVIDGVRINDPNTGHFSSYIPIAPAEIDRVEILKGASSALYGSEAVGGVVNIITKSFAGDVAAKSNHAVGQLTAGAYGLNAANAGFFGSSNKTSFSGGLLTNVTDGQPQRGIRGFVNAVTASASVAHRFSDQWQVAFRTAFDRRNFAAQNFYTAFVSDTAQETVQTFWQQLQMTHHAANHTLRVQAGYKNLGDSFAFNAHTLTNQNRSTMWQALVTDERRLSPKTSLTPGIQAISKRIVSNDRGNHTVNQAAAFLVLNQQFGESVYFSPAARLEWNERSGVEFVPQANLSYRTGALQLRGSAGKTIRDADFTERYNNYNKTFVASGRIGNPDLEAERSFSYEAGADYFFGKSLKLSTTYFQRFHKNLIDYVTTPYSAMPRQTNLSPTGVYALAKNIAKVTTTGVETDIQFSQVMTGGKSLWANLGITWLQSKTDNGVPSLYLSSHAKYLTNFNVQYRQGQVALTVNGLYKMRQPQAVASPLIAKVSTDYLVLNAKAEAFIWKNSLSLFIEADNLFDRRYTDLLGAVMPGRWLMGGLKFSLANE